MIEALATLGLDVGEEIGRGGFGVVYRARQRRLNRVVAVKVLATELDDTARRRFERECRAVGALSAHPHIVSVYESGVAGAGTPYLVMELLGGGTLADRLPLPWMEAAEIGVKVAGALETAHRAGVVHRDVKPQNVIFSDYGEPVVVDFGIASVEGGFETRSSSISATLAHTAPEILDGARSTPASDVYSLASTLHAVITGSAPFSGPPDQSVPVWLRRIATEEPADLMAWGVPAGMARAIQRGLSKSPGDRQPTAGEFGADLAEALAESGRAAPAMVVGEWSARADDPDADPDPAADVDVDVERAGEPLLSSAAASGAQRRRRALGAAAATLVLVTGLVAWRVGSSDDAGRVTTSKQPPRTTSTSTTTAVAVDGNVQFDDVTLTNGAVLARTWTMRPGGPFVSASEVGNPTDVPITTFVVETIPKEIAATTALVTFDPPSPTVLQDDPVVQWSVTVAPHESVHLSSSVTSPASSLPDDQLTQLAATAGADRARWDEQVRPTFCSATTCDGASTTVPADPVASVVDTAPGTTSKPNGVVSRPGVTTATTSRPGNTAAPVTSPVTAPVTAPIVTTAPPSPPSAPRSVVASDPQIAGGNCVDDGQIPSVSITLSWAAPSSNGGAAISGYDIVAEEVTGSGRVPVSVGAGVTSRTLTVPRSDQPNGYWRFTVAARSTVAGESAVASVRVPSIVGLCSWTAAQVLREVGLRPGYQGAFALQDPALHDQVFDQSTPAGQLVSAGSMLVFKNYASS